MMFLQQNTHEYTCMSPDKKTLKQIDHTIFTYIPCILMLPFFLFTN